MVYLHPAPCHDIISNPYIHLDGIELFIALIRFLSGYIRGSHLRLCHIYAKGDETILFVFHWILEVWSMDLADVLV